MATPRSRCQPSIPGTASCFRPSGAATTRGDAEAPSFGKDFHGTLPSEAPATPGSGGAVRRWKRTPLSAEPAPDAVPAEMTPT